MRVRFPPPAPKGFQGFLESPFLCLKSQKYDQNFNHILCTINSISLHENLFHGINVPKAD